MAVSLVGILLISAMIGAAVALGLLAVANRRIGIAVLLGGLAVVVGLPIMAIIMAKANSRSINVNSFPAVSVDSLPLSTEFHTVSTARIWAIAIMPLLFMAVAVAALLVQLFRRELGRTTAGGHGKIWPAFLVVPIVAIFMLGGLRIERSQSISTTAQIPAAQIQQQIHEQQQSLKKSQADLARQQAELAKQATALAESLHKQIDQLDIHELMDKFDAPRIVLKMPITPTPSPAALVIAAANAATRESNQNAASINDSSSKEAAEKEDAHGKNDAVAEAKKAQPSSHAEHQQTGEQSAAKPAKPTTVVVEAEAPPPPVPPTPPAPVAEPPIAAAPTAPAPAPAVPAKPVAIAQSISATTKVEAPPAPPAAATDEHTASSLPVWINDPPKLSGDIRREVIATDPYESDEECYQAADIYLMLRTYERLQQLKGQPYVASKLPSITFGNNGIVMADGGYISTGTSPTRWTDWRLIQLSQMGIGTDFLRRDIVAKNPGNNEPREYLETVQQSFGPMKKLYLQIEFTPAVDRELMQRWDALARQERFAEVGVGAGSILGLLLTVWGLLKLDTATKGYYSKWLFLGVPAAIIVGIVFCAADPFHMF